MKNWKVNWRLSLLGTAMGMLAMICITASAAVLMEKGTVNVELMPYWAAGILVVMGVAGGLTALLGGGSAVDAALTAVGEMAVLIPLNLVFSGGQMERIGVTALALGSGCGAAMLLCAGRGRGSGRRRRPRRKS